MGYAVYEDQDAQDRSVTRWAGYGVPASCDHPGCDTQINRGMGYKCETRYVEDGDGNGEENETPGCGLYFCGEHLNVGCPLTHDTFIPKPDSGEWEWHLLTDPSWQEWREQNPAQAMAHRAHLEAEIHRRALSLYEHATGAPFADDEEDSPAWEAATTEAERNVAAGAA